MFTVSRILYSPRRDGLTLLGVFAFGLAAGAALGPVTASRGTQIEAPQLPRPAATEKPAALRGGHPAEVLRVVDGDTFEARVRVWPGMEITTKIRLRGIDAPELARAQCDEERRKAIAARVALQAMLDQGDVSVSAVTLDKYGGRVLVDASTRATPDVSAALLGQNLVRSYAGGRREPWC